MTKKPSKARLEREKENYRSKKRGKIDYKAMDEKIDAIIKSARKFDDQISFETNENKEPCRE